MAGQNFLIEPPYYPSPSSAGIFISDLINLPTGGAEPGDSGTTGSRTII